MPSCDNIRRARHFAQDRAAIIRLARFRGTSIRLSMLPQVCWSRGGSKGRDGGKRGVPAWTVRVFPDVCFSHACVLSIGACQATDNRIQLEE